MRLKTTIFFSFGFLRASGGCVLLNISERMRLLVRGYVTRGNGAVAGVMEGGDDY